MARMFEINGKKYAAKPFDYNLVCDLDDMGISIDNMAKKSNAFTRAYISLCMRTDLETAGKEIEAHIVAGGDLNEITKALIAEIEESDFFQALKQNAKTDSQEEMGETETETAPTEVISMQKAKNAKK